MTELLSPALFLVAGALLTALLRGGLRTAVVFAAPLLTLWALPMTRPARLNSRLLVNSPSLAWAAIAPPMDSWATLTGAMPRYTSRDWSCPLVA